MWKWFLSLFVKPKLLMAPLQLALRDVDKTEELEVWENPLEPTLFEALAKARQEAFEPVLPEHLKPVVKAAVNIVLPNLFKKSLVAKEDLILMSESDVRDHHPAERFGKDEWHITKIFIIKELIDQGIHAELATSSDFVKVSAKQILGAIKDYKPPVEEPEIPSMNSVGIYR